MSSIGRAAGQERQRVRGQARRRARRLGRGVRQPRHDVHAGRRHAALAHVLPEPQGSSQPADQQADLGPADTG